MNPLNTALVEGKSVVVFGELLFDIIHRQNSELTEELPGGAPANFAYRFLTRQAGNDRLQVRLVSSIGRDRLGDKIHDFIKSSGLDPGFIQRSIDYPTGSVDVTVTDRDVNYVINKNVAYDHIATSPELLAIAADAKVFYFGSLIQRAQGTSASTLRSMLEIVPASAIKFVDINLRNGCYNSDSLRWSVNNASVLKLNDKEWPEVAQASGIEASGARDFAEKLALRDRKTVIVTLAERGAFVVSHQQGRVCFHYEAGYNLGNLLVDTIGSGDSFAAEFARLLANGKPLKQCLRSANIIGASAALTKGGQSLILENHFKSVERATRVTDRSIVPEIRI